VHRFRHDDCWALHPPGPGCEFHVKALKDAPVSYTISLVKVQQFARIGWKLEGAGGVISTITRLEDALVRKHASA
jgi:hypothetical protein